MLSAGESVLLRAWDLALPGGFIPSCRVPLAVRVSRLKPAAVSPRAGFLVPSLPPNHCWHTNHMAFP